MSYGNITLFSHKLINKDGMDMSQVQERLLKKNKLNYEEVVRTKQNPINSFGFPKPTLSKHKQSKSHYQKPVHHSYMVEDEQRLETGIFRPINSRFFKEPTRTPDSS